MFLRSQLRSIRDRRLGPRQPERIRPRQLTLLGNHISSTIRIPLTDNVSGPRRRPRMRTISTPQRHGQCVKERRRHDQQVPNPLQSHPPSCHHWRVGRNHHGGCCVGRFWVDYCCILSFRYLANVSVSLANSLHALTRSPIHQFSLSNPEKIHSAKPSSLNARVRKLK